MYCPVTAETGDVYCPVTAETGDVADAEEEEDDGIPKPSPNADTTILFVRPAVAAVPGGMGTSPSGVPPPRLLLNVGVLLN